MAYRIYPLHEIIDAVCSQWAGESFFISVLNLLDLYSFYTPYSFFVQQCQWSLPGMNQRSKPVDQLTIDRDTEGPELSSQSLFYAPSVLFPAIDFFHLSSTYFLNLSSIKSHVLALPTCSNVPLLLAPVMIQYSSTPSPTIVPITP